MRTFKWLLLVLGLGCAVPRASFAHPGTGIVVDRLGRIYFVDMVSGVWQLDTHGVLTHLPGPAFHWLALDEADRFSRLRLPSGPGGEIARLGVSPTLLLASDVPLAIGNDGAVYFPSHVRSEPMSLLRLASSGEVESIAELPAAPRDLNGFAAGPDGSLYYTENDAIRRVDSRGRVTTIAQKIRAPGCPPPHGASDNPLLRGLTVDRDGTIYVAATACRGVLKIASSGQVTSLPQVEAAWSPTGVTLFGIDLYVLEYADADTDDRAAMLPRIRKISADGSTTVIATVTHH